MKEISKKETNIDKINKYLKSIGEDPIVEGVVETEGALQEESNLDKINKYLKSVGVDPIVETVKKTVNESSCKPTSSYRGLMESLNVGFEKRYGKIDGRHN